MWLVDGGCDDEVDQKRSVLMLLLLLLCMLWHVFVFWFRAASLKLFGGNYLSHRPRLSHSHHVVTWEGSRIRGSPRNRKMLRRHILAISDNVRHG